MINKNIFAILLVLCSSIIFAQQDINELSRKLDDLAVIKKGLNENIKIDVAGLSLHDFLAVKISKALSDNDL